MGISNSLADTLALVAIPSILHCTQLLFCLFVRLFLLLFSCCGLLVLFPPALLLLALLVLLSSCRWALLWRFGCCLAVVSFYFPVSNVSAVFN